VGERSEYTPGTFCAVDLLAADVEQGKAFYAGLFGWDHGDPYRDWIACLLDGKIVAGLLNQPDDQREAGIPPNWLSYVSVTDAESDAARAAELGGKVLAPATDVGEGGRIAILADPQGAPFGLWQPIGFAGAQLVNVPGALTWNQLYTSDPEAAVPFYTELFGWATEVPGGGEGVFWSVKNSEGWLNGGVMGLPPGTDGPPNWTPFFASADLKQHEARVKELGGSPLSPILPVPAGELFVAQDDQGAVFGLTAAEFDP
jgi:predicted enzyme related to lactoylglutathione lyase